MPLGITVLLAVLFVTVVLVLLGILMDKGGGSDEGSPREGGL